MAVDDDDSWCYVVRVDMDDDDTDMYYFSYLRNALEFCQTLGCTNCRQKKTDFFRRVRQVVIRMQHQRLRLGPSDQQEARGSSSPARHVLIARQLMHYATL